MAVAQHPHDAGGVVPPPGRAATPSVAAPSLGQPHLGLLVDFRCFKAEIHWPQAKDDLHADGKDVDFFQAPRLHKASKKGLGQAARLVRRRGCRVGSVRSPPNPSRALSPSGCLSASLLGSANGPLEVLLKRSSRMRVLNAFKGSSGSLPLQPTESKWILDDFDP